MEREEVSKGRRHVRQTESYGKMARTEATKLGTSDLPPDKVSQQAG